MVMGHERLAIVLANMPIYVEAGLTPQVAEELPGMVVLDS